MKRLALIIGLCLTLAACVPKPEEMPSATVEFFARPAQMDAVQAATKRFAKDHGFIFGSVRLGERSPKELVIHLVRYDAQVIGRDPFEPGRFQFFFYKNRGGAAASDKEMNELADSFVIELRKSGEFNPEKI